MVHDTLSPPVEQTRSADPRADRLPRYVVWCIGLFFVALLTPVIFEVGSLNIPATRLYLLILFVPALFACLSGRAGRIRAVDLLIVAATVWWSLSFFANHPVGSVYQQVGFTVLETLGGYMLGRWLIRSAGAFTFFVRANFLAVLFTLPFALLEMQTGDPIIMTTLRQVVKTPFIVNHELRLGFERAQVVFQHPILYGVFCAAAFGLVVHTLNRTTGLFTAVFRGGVVVVTTFSSLSTGAFLTLLVQMCFMGWNRVLAQFGARWKFFAAGVVTLYVLIDVFSTRTPFHVFVSYMTLNSSTAWNRIRIFDHGMNNVWANPIFGLGLHDWVRPHWMVSSVDNFWLVLAMRHGIPSFLFFAAALVLLIGQLSFARLVSAEARAARTGYLISLGGLIVALSTVHIWSEPYIWFMFLLGAGVWMIEPQPQTGAPATPDSAAQPEGQDRALRYSRFPLDKARARPAPRARAVSQRVPVGRKMR